MKADPINFFFDKQFKIDKTYYAISGNEETLIQRLKEELILKIREKKDYSIEKIKNISNKDKSVGLFQKNKLYIVSEPTNLDQKTILSNDESGDIFIFTFANSPKNNQSKKFFLNNSNALIFDCYELNKEQKVKIINWYFNNLDYKLNENTYWSLVERLDNRFAFLENDLRKINALKHKRGDEDILNLISNNNNDIEKLFFKIFESNEKIVKSYNEKITNINELNSLYYSIKQFCLLILSHEKSKEFENNIPRYLFREKGIFLKIFNKFNKKKRVFLLSLLYKTERSMRVNQGLSLVTGLRFVLSLKKITIS